MIYDYKQLIADVINTNPSVLILSYAINKKEQIAIFPSEIDNIQFMSEKKLMPPKGWKILKEISPSEYRFNGENATITQFIKDD